MFSKYLKDCREFVAGDDSILRELLHPEKTGLQIRYSLAHAEVRVGQMTKPHKLQAAEVYYIIAGQGLMHIDEESLEVGPKCAVYIPPQARRQTWLRPCAQMNRWAESSPAPVYERVKK